MKRILTVCIGNICRSPLAEVALRQALPADWQVWSAGLQALVGMPADPTSKAIAQEQGLDLSAHRAQQFTGWMAQQADVILVMEDAHVRMLRQMAPTAQGKVYRLGHLRRFDIEDPYRQPRAAFDAAWAGISRGVADWAPRLQRL
jgi:protein-tyrosine phosphatase